MSSGASGRCSAFSTISNSTTGCGSAAAWTSPVTGSPDTPALPLPDREPKEISPWPAIPPAPLCIGQKQKWFLLRFIGDERSINFNTSDTPEFCNWDWVHYWTPIKQVISFKRQVYRKALEEFYPLLKYRKVRR